MFCRKCGASLPDGGVFCTACGAPQGPSLPAGENAAGADSTVPPPGGASTPASAGAAKKKPALWIAAAAAVLILAAAAVLLLKPGGETAPIVGKWSTLYAYAKGDDVTINSGILGTGYVDVKKDGAITVYLSLTEMTLTGSWEYFKEGETGPIYKVKFDGGGTGLISLPEEGYLNILISDAMFVFKK